MAVVVHQKLQQARFRFGCKIITEIETTRSIFEMQAFVSNAKTQTNQESCIKK